MPRSATLARRAALAVAVVAALAALAAAQPPADDPPGELFIDSIDVNVVNVDVVVTDRSGRRVTGLTVDDFELLEDGGPVVISNFYAVEAGRRRAPAPAAPPAAAPPPARLRDDVGADDVAPADQNLRVVLFFDNLFLQPFSRNRVSREVRSFIRGLEVDAEVMLVTFERALHIRHPFTSDRRAIADALTEIEMLTGHATAADSDRGQILRQIDRARDHIEATSFVESYADEQFHDVQRSIGGLRELVGSLAGLPGRKAIVHVSDGLPLKAAEDLFYLLDLRYPGRTSGLLAASRYSARRYFSELAAHANANRVTFYTIEAQGLRSHGSLSAEYGGTDRGSMIDVDNVKAVNQQATLQMLAADTGGLSAFNTNDVAGALDRMSEDFRSYYSLGYVPAHSGDGRYHDVEVRLKDRSLSVRHRAGYRDKSPETRVAEGTMAALLYGVESNPLGVELEVGRPRPEGGQFLVPVRARVPLGRVVLVPQEAAYRGALRFSVAVVDEESATSPVQQTPVPLAVPNDEVEVARKQFYVYEVELLMRPGQQTIGVGVRDELSGETSYLRRHVRIGA